MKKALLEFIYLLASFLKWLFLGALAGAVVGFIGTGFLWILKTACDFTAQWQYYFVLLPFAMFVSSFLIKYLAPEADGHGTEKAIRAIHKNNGRIKLAVIPVKLVATVVTLSLGGSAGKEGPTTQIGAGAASGLASLLRLNDRDRKKLVICGMSAAFAAIFGTPVAAAIFAIEVLVVGKIRLNFLFPAFISAVAGWFIANIWIGPKIGTATEVFHLAVPEISFSTMGISLGAGLFFGLVALLLVLAMKYFEKFSHKIKIFKPLKGLIGGAVLVGLGFLVGTQYLGMGVGYFMNVASGAPAQWYDFLIKILFTAITLSFGGSGGILTPIMFIGITSGSAFAGLFGLDYQFFAALGLLAVLASATNTPMACTVMAIEMFNPAFAVYAAIACPAAYLMTGHRSVYPTQLLAESKTSSILIADSEEIGEGGRETFLLPKRFGSFFKKWFGNVDGIDFKSDECEENGDISLPEYENSVTETASFDTNKAKDAECDADGIREEECNVTEFGDAEGSGEDDKTGAANGGEGEVGEADSIRSETAAAEPDQEK